MQWLPLTLVGQIDHGVSMQQAGPLINQREAFGDFNILHDDASWWDYFVFMDSHKVLLH